MSNESSEGVKSKLLALRIYLGKTVAQKVRGVIRGHESTVTQR